MPLIESCFLLLLSADWVKNVSKLNLPADEKAAIDKLIDSQYEKLEEETGLEFLNIEGSALYSIER